MTTAVFARAGRMADQVREESRDLDPLKVALTMLMVLPFVLGWLAGKTLMVVWTMFAWVWTAALVGFRTARNESRESPI